MSKVERLTNSTTGGPVFVDVKDGKILRITPMDLDDSDGQSWTIEARGRTFTPPRRTTVMPYTAGHKSMIYSPKRVLTPLKRVDFDPNGERNCEKRGESGYEAISWDEALDIVTGEINRIKRTYGPGAMLTTCGSHHLWGNVGYRHSAYQRFSNLVGLVQAAHNPDSWEGWHWGGMHMWGYSHRLGIPEQYDLLEDALKHTEMIVFWSADPESTGGGIYSAFESTVRRFWLKELGVKMIFIDPYYNHTAGLIADKWFSPRLGTDVALGLGIAYTWLTEGTYDKEYVAGRTVGFDEWKAYVLGRVRRRAQDAGVGRRREPDPGARHPGARPGMGRQEDHAGLRVSGRLGRRVPFGHRERVGPHDDRSGRHAGHGQAGQQHLGDVPGLSRRRILPLPRLRRRRHRLRPGKVRGRIPLGEPHVRGQAGSHPPYARLHRGPGDLPPAHPRGAAAREAWNFGARGSAAPRSRASSRNTSIPAPGYPFIHIYWRYGGSFFGTMTETNRYVKSYRNPKLQFAVSQPIWLEGEAKFADIVLPACTNFERWDISEFASCSGYIPDSLHADQQPGLHVAEEVHRAAGREQVGLRDLRRGLRPARGSAMLYTMGGKDEYQWTKEYFQATDLPKYVSWEKFEKKGYFVLPFPKEHKSTPACAGSPRTGSATLRTGVRIPPTRSVSKACRPRPARSSSCRTASPASKTGGNHDPERPPLGPQFIPSWEGHHTTELYDKYPAAAGLAPPAVQLPHHGRRQGQLDERGQGPPHSDRRLLLLEHADQHPGRRRARYQRAATSSAPSTTGAR